MVEINWKKLLKNLPYNEDELKKIISPIYNGMTNKKCIAFTRVSTESQELSSQSESIVKEALKMGYSKDNIISIDYKESGITKGIDERDGIKELKEKIISDPEIDCVIIWELSRIGRRADVIYNIRDFFIQHKIQFIVLTPYMRLLDVNGEMSQTASLMLGIFTVMVEQEMVIKQERMKRGLRKRIEEGYYHGGPNFLFGYMPNEEKRMVPNPKTAPIVQKIFEMYVNGEWTMRSLGQHLKDLDEFNVKYSSSCLGKVHAVLNDSRYVGTHKMYPPIISMELWEKAQQKLKERKIGTKLKNSHEMLLKGIIRSKYTKLCMACIPGNKMYQSAGDEKPMIYVPQRAVDGPIYEMAVNLHKKFFTNPAARQRKLLDELKIINKKFRTATQECATIQERIDRLEERLIIGNISEERANELLKRFKTQLSEATERKNLYEREAREKGQQMYDDYWHEDNGAYENLSYREKREIILSTIECIYATRSQEDSRYVLLEIHTINKNILHLKIQTRKYYKHIKED